MHLGPVYAAAVAISSGCKDAPSPSASLTTITPPTPTATFIAPSAIVRCKPCPSGQTCLRICIPETVTVAGTGLVEHPTSIPTTPYVTTICEPCTGEICAAVCKPITTTITPAPLPTTPYTTVICEPCTAEVCPAVCKFLTTVVTPSASASAI